MTRSYHYLNYYFLKFCFCIRICLFLHLEKRNDSQRWSGNFMHTYQAILIVTATLKKFQLITLIFQVNDGHVFNSYWSSWRRCGNFCTAPQSRYKINNFLCIVNIQPATQLLLLNFWQWLQPCNLQLCAVFDGYQGSLVHLFTLRLCSKATHSEQAFFFLQSLTLGFGILSCTFVHNDLMQFYWFKALWPTCCGWFGTPACIHLGYRFMIVKIEENKN